MREGKLGSVMMQDDWIEIASFMAELEGLRLRMIDTCLSGQDRAVEPPRALAFDRVSSDGARLQQFDRGSLIVAVQDEVASAVRLLVSADNSGRQK